MILLFVAFLVSVAALLAVAFRYLPDPSVTPDRVVAAQVRKLCVVTCKNNDTFRGVLDEADDRALILANTILDDGNPVDGRLLILRADVAFIQLL